MTFEGKFSATGQRGSCDKEYSRLLKSRDEECIDWLTISLCGELSASIREHATLFAPNFLRAWPYRCPWLFQL